MKRDYYESLGVDRGVAPDDLKKAYRKLAHRYHPDKNPDDPQAEARFKEASEAYAVLSDSEKRTAYDRLGHAAFQGASGGDPFAGFDPFSSFSDLFNEFFGADLFGSRGARRRGAGRRGADLRYDLDVDFEVAARGGEESIRIPKHRGCEECGGTGGDRETCPRCQGYGQVQLQQGFFRISRTCDGCGGVGQRLKRACSGCRGQGRVESVQKMSVRIPAGIETGTRLRLSGEGEAGYDGGPPGDLYVVLGVREHALFKRHGANLICEVPISMAQAALGAEVEVPGLDGKEMLEVKAGTQSGEIIRLRGKGLPFLSGGGHGDQIVQFFVEVPTRLSDRQREILEEFAREARDDVTPRRRGFLHKLRELFD